MLTVLFAGTGLALSADASPGQPPSGGGVLYDVEQFNRAAPVTTTAPVLLGSVQVPAGGTYYAINVTAVVTAASGRVSPVLELEAKRSGEPFWTFTGTAPAPGRGSVNGTYELRDSTGGKVYVYAAGYGKGSYRIDAQVSVIATPHFYGSG